MRQLITVSLIKFGLNYSNIDFSLLRERESMMVDTIGNIIISSSSQGERPGGDGDGGGVICE